MTKFILGGVSALILTCALQAAPITYTFSGNGTGTINGSSFTDANFLVTLTGNTADIAFFANLGNTLGDETLSGSIAITGIGTASFNQQLFIYTSNTPVDVLGFGTFAGNLISIVDPAFTGYGLATNLGPVTGTNVFLYQFHDVPTSLGTLTYSSMSDATFNASTSAVPEPASVVITGAGIAVLLIGLRCSAARA